MDYTVSSIAPIVLLPFFAFALNTFIVKRSQKTAVGISCLAILGSFLFASKVFYDFVFRVYSKDYYIHKIFNWIDLSFGQQVFKVDLGIYVDNMTAIMLFMVTGVATLIHVFSTFYMHDDDRFGHFFVYMSLFTSAMLGLVLSDNLLSIFMFWELMGFCSYSLIGFYFKKEEAGNASMKAFMTTRVGDVGFLLGILAIWSVVGNVNIVDIYKALEAGKFGTVGLFGMNVSMATLAAFCIFMGTIGKSAQFPLQVWLPDAMMGPTPCSALIHAATMVAAGVYLSLRMYPLMEAGHLTTLIAYIGAITAFGAATIAVIQTDIKAVLAFSTISQLGYMVMGIGVGSYNAAFMHLITHAVFKACLFLSAGSVIHSLHDHHTHGHVQEMPRMGGLRKKLPFTFIAMLLCTLAIIGFPFFSGFVSKDRILGDVLYFGLSHPQHMLVPILGFSGALLTAFYMCRMLFMTFFGEPRDHEVYEHAHHEHLKWNQNVPLLILSLFTFGFVYSGSLTGMDPIHVFPDSKFEWFQTLVQKPVLPKFKDYKHTPFAMTDEGRGQTFEPSHYDAHHEATDGHGDAHLLHTAHNMGAAASLVIVFIGIMTAFLIYVKRSINPERFVKMFPGLYRALQNRYYFDYFYIKVVIQKGFLGLCNRLAFFDLGIYDRIAIDGWENVNRAIYRMSSWFDRIVVDRIFVDGTGDGVKLFNVILRTIQSGKIQLYFFVVLFVLAGLIWRI